MVCHCERLTTSEAICWDSLELQGDCFVAIAPRNDMHRLFLMPDNLVHIIIAL